MTRRRWLTRVLASGAAGLAALFSPAVASAATPNMTPIVQVSTCSGQNAEVEQATDPTLGYVYEDWMAAGCQNIAFARSTDGGKTFSSPISLPGATGSTFNSWDPAVTVAPSDGTVYAAYMRAKNSQWFPVVAVSHDHGKSFPQVTELTPPDAKNWGDRDFIAVDPHNSNLVYLTYDYGPERTSNTFTCASNGSCAFLTGDLNVVIQRSTDGGLTWTPPMPINQQPAAQGGFPASGGDSAPIFVEPSGRIDLLYQGYTITNLSTYTMDPAHQYFVYSTDRGNHWSTPVRLPDNGQTMSLDEWWIDGALAVDSAGNLYASWDTQDEPPPQPSTVRHDTGWLDYSTDHGQTWQGPIRVTNTNPVPHIMEVTAGAPGTAYVSYLTEAPDANGVLGYVEYLQRFSINGGLQGKPILVSGSIFGDVNTWPGDTTGLSTVGANDVTVSWGSGVPMNNQPKSEIFERVVSFSP
jgi:hypothetical protein